MKTILFWGSKEYPIGYKYSDNLAGGIESSFQRIINDIKQKFKIIVITRKFKMQQTLEKQENVDIIRIRTPPTMKGFFYNLNSFIYLLFHKCNYDLVLTSGILATFFAGVLKFFKKNKFKVYCRWDTPAYLSKTKLLYPLEKITYSLLVDCFLLKTDFEVNRIKKLYSLKKINFSIVGFGYPINISEDFVLKKTEINFIYIGRLNKIKNIYLMIDVFDLVFKEINGKLNIYGDGPLKTKMLKYIKLKKLNDKIIYHGFDKNASNRIKNNDFLVLLSKVEGLPNVVIEAMGQKTPVILSNIGLFNKDVVYLINLETDKQVADSILSFINNKHLQNKIKNNAYKYYLYYFNYDKMIDNYITVFNKR